MSRLTTDLGLRESLLVGLGPPKLRKLGDEAYRHYHPVACLVMDVAVPTSMLQA